MKSCGCCVMVRPGRLCDASHFIVTRDPLLGSVSFSDKL
jgi:hypothetical protein